MRRQQPLQMLFERSPPGGRDKRAIDNALDLENES